MAHLSPAVRRAFTHADSIPADVLARLSQAELADRLVYSRALVRKASQARTPAEKRAIMTENIAMLKAQPRTATEREVAQKITKAAQVPDAFHGSALRRSAQELLTTQPPAPRNQDAELIVKAVAGEDGLMACYDENGCIVGACPKSALTPVLPPSQIAKALATAPGTRVRKTAGGTAPAGHVPAYDQDGGFVGYVKPEDITDPASAQARNRGPVNADGTTGLGKPRTGAAQQALPGDVPGRQVIKTRQTARRGLRAEAS